MNQYFTVFPDFVDQYWIDVDFFDILRYHKGGDAA